MGGDREDLTAQITEGKAIARPGLPDYTRINNYFEAELEQYLDMNSSLTLEDLRSNDGSVEITCAVLQTATDLSRVSVTSYIDWTFPYNKREEYTLVMSAINVSAKTATGGQARNFISKVQVVFGSGVGGYPGDKDFEDS